MLPKNYSVYIVAALGWTAALTAMGAEVGGIDHETIKAFLGDVASNQIAQAGFFFTAAAWLHSGRVKKEIKLNFVGLTEAINSVADSLKEDLRNHSDRVDHLANRISILENEKAV